MPFNFIFVALLLFFSNSSFATEVPTFSLTALNQKKPINLSDYHGQTIILDFWASWCAPCLKSLPVYQNWHVAGEILVVSVNVDDDLKDAIAMIKDLNLTFPVAYDYDKSVAKLFGVYALPVAFLIDKNGKIMLRHEGYQSKDAIQLLQEIQKINSLH
jgi:thiol-disulfide isomerase/thioredoxin